MGRGWGRQVLRIFRNANFDAVIHFAAVAYVGESVAEPLRYYDNITSNTVTLLKTMTATGVNRLIYSRCARGFFSHVTTRHPGRPPASVTQDDLRLVDGREGRVRTEWV